MPRSPASAGAGAPSPASPGTATTGADGAWRRFLRTLFLTAGLVVAATYAVVLLVDPYDCLWFSLPLQRAPVTASDRYSFPALARNPEFDSAVISSSVLRTLRPPELDAALGGRFVNLALDGSTPYEQSRLLEVFVRAHPAPRTVIIATDVAWCQPVKPYAVASGDRFPDWLYDDGRWDKLATLFSATAITDTIRQLRWMVGMAPASRALDGFGPLYPGIAWDLARTRARLYGGTAPQMRPPAEPPFVVDDQLRRQWLYPDHARLAAMLASLPAATRKILVFPPIHHYSQGAPGSPTAAQWRLCKEGVTRLAAATPNAHVLDFLIYSAITLRDEDYWDEVHHRVETGSQIIRLIAQAVDRRAGVPGFLDYLHGPSEAAAP